MHVVILAIVANLFHHGTDSGLVFTNQLGIFDLFMFQDFDRAFLFGKSKFEVRNTRSYFMIQF